jgi:histidinol-phosphate/aromatic aminotransferase/cobyric acid decarboxylase-like protein
MIERQTPAEAGNQYGKTTVRVKPNQTPITEDKTVLESILTSQSDLTELYTEPSYDELKEVLANYLNPNDESETATITTTTTQTTPPTPTEKKTENVEDAFDQLFNG